jgi:hypothetical protein
MSLASRLTTVVASPSNRGCVTCAWIEGISKADRAALDAWIISQNSLSQLWEIFIGETPPLNVGLSGFRNHFRHHRTADES